MWKTAEEFFVQHDLIYKYVTSVSYLAKDPV